MQTRAVIKAALNVSAETGHVITPHIMIRWLARSRS